MSTAALEAWLTVGALLLAIASIACLTIAGSAYLGWRADRWHDRRVDRLRQQRRQQQTNAITQRITS